MASSSSSATPLTVHSSQQRHYCIVLTNNLRMIRSAQRLLSYTTQSTTQDIYRTEQQSLPISSIQPAQMDIQMQQPLDAPMLTQSKRRIAINQSCIEQQVPTTMPHVTNIDIAASNTRVSEKEIETDFQTQVQPILELFLRRTQRPSPINSVLDMSSYIQF